MKITRTCSLVPLCFALLALSVFPALADKANGPKAKLFAKYDKNNNKVIDGDEKDALRKDFPEDKEGNLKRFDKNKDGKLDDEEIAAIKPPAAKQKSDKAAGEKSGKAKAESGAKADTNKAAAEKAEKPAQPAVPEKPAK